MAQDRLGLLNRDLRGPEGSPDDVATRRSWNELASTRLPTATLVPNAVLSRAEMQPIAGGCESELRVVDC